MFCIFFFTYPATTEIYTYGHTLAQHDALPSSGGIAAAAALPGGMVRKAEAAAPKATGEVKTIKTVCTHCSVGCTVMAEVQNGVWIGQEPGFDSPLNLGAHCAKGAAIREHANGERRLTYPMKLVDGKTQKHSWDTQQHETS